jgi:hypothetical protein
MFEEESILSVSLLEEYKATILTQLALYNLTLVFFMSLGNIGFALKLHFLGSHKDTLLWDVISCSIVAIYRYFGRIIPQYTTGQ